MTEKKRTGAATTPVNPTIYVATFVDAPTLGQLRIRPDLAVAVDSHGTIVHVGSLDAVQKQMPAPVVDLRGSARWVVPGFIDTHIHASQYANIGIGAGMPLLKWLDNYTFDLEKNVQADVEVARAMYSQVIRRTLESGTTLGSYFTTVDTKTTCVFADLAMAHGQRALVGKVCMDHNTTWPDYQESLDSCQELSQALDDFLAQLDPSGRLVAPIITPRYAPVCLRPMLTWLGQRAAERQLSIQTHMSENTDEIKMVLEDFPECTSYAGVYDEYKLLTERTILAHCVHLTPEDLALVVKNRCSVSHCPTSNTFLLSGQAPVKKYLYHDNVNVGLGTDVSGGFDALMLAMVKHAVLVSHHLAMTSDDDVRLSVADALYMATTGGAVAVDRGGSLGSFDVGKQFDAQYIALDSPASRVDVFSWQSFDDLIQKWVFTGDDRNCVKVWVDGRLVIDKLTP